MADATFRFDGDNSGLRRTIAGNRQLLEQSARDAERAEAKSLQASQRRLAAIQRDQRSRARPLRADRGESPFTIESLGKSTGTRYGIAGVIAAKVGLDFVGNTLTSKRKRDSSDLAVQNQGKIEQLEAFEKVPILGELFQFIFQLNGTKEALEKQRQELIRGTAAAKGMAEAQDKYGAELVKRIDPTRAAATARHADFNEEARTFNKDVLGKAALPDQERARAAIEKRRTSMSHLDTLDAAEAKEEERRRREGTIGDATINAYATGKRAKAAQARAGGDQYGALFGEQAAEFAETVRKSGNALRAAQAEVDKATLELDAAVDLDDPGLIDKARKRVLEAEDVRDLTRTTGFAREEILRANQAGERKKLVDDEAEAMSQKAEEDARQQHEQNVYDKRLAGSRFDLQTRAAVGGMAAAGRPEEGALFGRIREMAAEIRDAQPELKSETEAAVRMELKAMKGSFAPRGGGMVGESVFGRDIIGDPMGVNKQGNEDNRQLDLINSTLEKGFADLLNKPEPTI